LRGTILDSDAYNRPVSSTFEQQPIQRTVGRRTARDGRPLTAAERSLITRNAQYQTRAPKGVYRYTSPAAMEADRLRWTVDLIAERNRQR
jgi:hypothetical protein